MPRPQGPFMKGRKYQDEIQHKKHWGFLRQKAQAKFRGEGWDMTIDEFFEIWPDELWAKRGRSPDNYCMVRVDIEKPWSLDNCVIVIRYQQLVRGKNPRLNPKLGFPKL
jgi:hypothetical protein